MFMPTYTIPLTTVREVPYPFPENYVFPGDEEKTNEESNDDHEQDRGL